MKRLGIALLAVTLIFAGALFLFHNTLDDLLRAAITEYGSEMTKAKVSVGGVKINAADGQGAISDLDIGNPRGFKTSHAFKVKEFSVAIDPTSLTGGVIIVKKIAITGPHVIYEKSETITNFDAIQRNISDYIGPSGGKSPESGKKLIVEELTIQNAQMQAAATFLNGKTITINLPDITLRNLGKAKGGITPGQLGKEIVGALQKQLSSAVDFDKLGKAVSNRATKAARGAEEATGKAANKVKSLF